MGYDYGIGEISKFTGITGIAAKHIAKDLDKHNIDWMSIDWKTIGEDVKDFGDRYNAIWDKLRNMYGISKSMTGGAYKKHVGKFLEHKEIPVFTQKEIQLEMCLDVHLRRSARSIMLDDKIAARIRFKPTNLKGVQLWMKNPNKYDIIGVDYFPRVSKKRKGKKRR